MPDQTNLFLHGGNWAGDRLVFDPATITDFNEQLKTHNFLCINVRGTTGSVKRWNLPGILNVTYIFPLSALFGDHNILCASSCHSYPGFINVGLTQCAVLASPDAIEVLFAFKLPEDEGYGQAGLNMIMWGDNESAEDATVEVWFV